MVLGHPLNAHPFADWMGGSPSLDRDENVLTPRTLSLMMAEKVAEAAKVFESMDGETEEEGREEDDKGVPSSREDHESFGEIAGRGRQNMQGISETMDESGRRGRHEAAVDGTAMRSDRGGGRELSVDPCDRTMRSPNPNWAAAAGVISDDDDGVHPSIMASTEPASSLSPPTRRVLLAPLALGPGVPSSQQPMKPRQAVPGLNLEPVDVPQREIKGPFLTLLQAGGDAGGAVCGGPICAAADNPSTSSPPNKSWSYRAPPDKVGRVFGLVRSVCERSIK